MTQDEFVKAALDDCQQTIRALDVKCGAVLVLLLAPLAAFGRIFKAIESLGPGCVWIPTAAIFLALWGMAILTMLRALAPLDSPSAHIPDGTSAKGTFYRPGMYSIGFLDALLLRKTIMSSKSIVDAAAELPQAGAGLLAELTFEHMKVCYIRDMKMSLLAGGFRFTQGWLVLGIVIYITARYAGAAA